MCVRKERHCRHVYSAAKDLLRAQRSAVFCSSRSREAMQADVATCVQSSSKNYFLSGDDYAVGGIGIRAYRESVDRL